MQATPAAIDWANSAPEFTNTINWTNGAIVNDTTSTIGVFGNAAIVAQPTLGNASFSLAGVRFGSAAGNFTLSAAGGNTLTLGASGVENQSTTNPQIISAPLVFSTAASITNAGTLTISGPVTNNTTGLVLTGAGSGGTISGAISGSGPITMSGAGVWALTAVNTYTGATAITSGTLAINSDNSLGAAPATATPGALTFGGGTLEATQTMTLDSNRGVLLSPGGGTIQTDAAVTLTYGGVIAGTDFLNKTGNGTLALGGANNFSGNTNVKAGVLQDTAANAYSSASQLAIASGASVNVTQDETVRGLSDITGAGGTVTISSGKTLTLNGGSTFSGVIGGSGALALSGPSPFVQVLAGNSTYSGGTTIAGNMSLQIGIGPAGVGGTSGSIPSGNIVTNGALEFFRSDAVSSGGISGTGSVQQLGSGTLTLSGTNTYSGGTYIQAGTVTGALPSSGNVYMYGGNFTVPADQAIGGLGDMVVNGITLPGNVSIAGGATLTLNGGNTFSGLLGGSGALTVGSGVVEILAGNVSVVGSTTINSGATLQLGNGGNSGSISGPIVDNGVLALDVNDGTSSGAISGTGGVLKMGNGNYTIVGANSYAGTTVIRNGTLLVGADGALPTGTNVVLSSGPGNTATLDLNGKNQTIGSLTLGGSAATATAAVKLTGGNLTLGGTVKYDASAIPNGATINNGTVVLGGDRTFDVGSSSPAESNGWDLSVGAAITGTGNVTKTGAGILQLEAANTYTGATIVNDGRLRVIGNGTLPSSTNVVVDELTNGIAATIDLGGTTQTIGTLTLRGATNSTNKVDLGPGGTLTLGGDVRYDATNNPSGATISNGTALQLGAATRTFTVDDSTAATVDLTISSPITGSVGLTKAGAGTLLLAANNSYTGMTTVSAGTLQIGNGSSGSIAGDLTNNAAVVFSRFDNPTYAGAISGNGTVAINGDVTLAGANSYAGNTTIGNGVLTVVNTAGSGTGSGTVIVQPAATLQIGDGHANGSVVGSIVDSGDVEVNQSSNYTYGGAISGPGSLEKNGLGTLTLTGANTYQGVTTIWDGTLKVGTTNALPSGTMLNIPSVGTLELGAAQTIRNIESNNSGSIVIDGGVTFTFAPTSDIQFDSNISEAGGQGKLVVAAGGSYVTYRGTISLTGPTVVTSGTLDVSESGQLSSTGPLVIKPASGSFASVYIGDNGQTVGGLYFGGNGTLTGGQATLEMASGNLTLNGDVTFDATNNPQGARISGSGTLHLGAAARTFTVAHTTNSPVDLTIEPALSGTVDLVKAGVGSLLLDSMADGANGSNFTGNVTVAAGSLYVGNDYAAGIGQLTLQSGTVLASRGMSGPNSAITLSNAVVLNDNVTFGASGLVDGITLTGNVTVPSVATLHLATNRPVTFASVLSGSNSALTFDGGGEVVLDGSVNSISTIAANGSAVVVTNPVVLSSAGAPMFRASGGYVGVGAPATGTTPAVADLISHIDKANFNGTFGFDTTPGADSTIPHTFSDTLDFSSFNSNLTLGSTSFAVLTGTITPPVGATNYAFGNGGGVLAVQSNLTGAFGLSVVSSPTLNDNSLGVILQGTNTFSGNVAVTNSALVLDSAHALPSTATISLGASGYVSATDAFTSSTSFKNLLSRITSYTGTSVVGLDSHTDISDHLTFGSSSSSSFVTDPINLRSFTSIYLGTVTNVQLAGEILGPQSGTLSLVSIGDGTLVIDSNLHAGSASQVVLGSPNLGGDKGAIVMAGANSYTGGTTLNGGVVVAGHGSVKANGAIVAGPFGTGTLTVASGANHPLLLAGSSDLTVHNNIALGSTLQVGDLGLFGTNVSALINSLNQLVLDGTISGTGGLQISTPTVLNGNNSFSGGVNLVDGSLEVGSDSALGTGPLTLGGPNGFSGSNFQLVIDNGPRTLANDLIFSGFGSSSAELDITGTGKVTFTHPVMLNTGSVRLVTSDFPVEFQNTVSGFGDLEVSGRRAVILSAPTNTYSGGTFVASAAVIFGGVGSIPNSGQLEVDADGYIGIGAAPATATDLQNKFVNRFDKINSSGTIGLDSVSGGTSTYTGNVDLSNFSNSVRLGSATSAIVSGMITPTSTDYNFGGGGGTLTVTSNLINDPSVEGPTRNLEVWSPAEHPLTLVLTGANTYTGETRVAQSAVVFQSASAMQGGGLLCVDLGGYIGVQLPANTNAGTDSAVAGFLGRFDSAVAGSYLGFESGGGNTISDLDLSSGTFAAVGLATTSTLHVAGNLTIAPTSNYSLAGYKGGQLIVDSVLSGTHTVAIGDAAVPATFGDPNNPGLLSSVTLNADNSGLSGTVTLNAGNLYVGNDHALGTGSLIVAAGIGDEAIGVRPGLLAANTSALTNAINVNSDLNIGGGASLTLSGVLSGSGELYKVGGGMLTFSGTNSLTGGIYIQQGDVTFATGSSVGGGPIGFGFSVNSSATFLDSSVVNGISADSSNDSIVLASGKTLTVNQTFDAEFAGAFNGTTSGLTFEGGHKLKLSGPSTFVGPVTIQGGTGVLAATNVAFGNNANPVTVNGAKLAVASGVSVSNPITLTSGVLAGTGTFQAPSSAAAFNIGSGAVLSPGLGGAGMLSFDGSLISTSVLILAGNGTYHWDLMDATNAWDQVAVSGNVSITADSAHPFQFSMNSIAADGSIGFASNFDPTHPYSWTVLSATSISGFTGANQFAITGGLLNWTNGGTFSLGLNGSGNALMLNFSPVPEPSTYALMLAGLGLVGFAVRRRRRG